MTLTADNTIGGLAGSVLVIKPAALPASDAVTVTVQLTDVVSGLDTQGKSECWLQVLASSSSSSSLCNGVHCPLAACRMV